MPERQPSERSLREGAMPLMDHHYEPFQTCPHPDCVGQRMQAVRVVGEPAPEHRRPRLHPPRRYWRDVLGNIEDLLPDWQAQACSCKLDFSGPHQCYRCRVVSAVTKLKARIEEGK